MADEQWSPPDAAGVKRLWGEMEDENRGIVREYRLNYSYFRGDQWIRWNKHSSIAELLAPSDDSDDPNDWATVNKLKPRVLSLIARACKTPLAWEVRPEGVDQEAVRKAQLNRQVLEVTAHRHGWENVRYDAVQNTVLGAVSAICVEPDWEWKNDDFEITETGARVRLPERPAVKLTALAIDEFGVEPGTRKIEDASFWIRRTTLTPRQAKRHYKLAKEPSPDAEAQADTPMQRELASQRRGGGGNTGRNNACLVYVYYERPNPGVSPGCVVHVVGGEVVKQDAWPFPFDDRLNLAIFPFIPLSSTWKGDTILNDARQLQRYINRAYTSVNKHIGRADNARLIMPYGAVPGGDDDEFTGDVGEIVRVDDSGGQGPRWMQAPEIPRWLREHIDRCSGELDDLFSTHSVSRGEAPGDRNSGTALAILAEKDDTPLGPFATSQQRGWQQVAEMVLETMRSLMESVDTATAQANPAAQPMRVSDVQMKQDNDEAPTPVEWGAKDLCDDPIVQVPLDVVYPRNSVALMDQLVRLGGVFPQMFQNVDLGSLARLLSLPEPDSFGSLSDLAKQEAEWENQRIFAGADDTEVLPQSWQDHTKHIASHNEARMSASYRTADPSVRQHMDLHIEAHTKLVADQAMQNATPAAPGVTATVPGQPPPAGGPVPSLPGGPPMGAPPDMGGPPPSMPPDPQAAQLQLLNQQMATQGA